MPYYRQEYYSAIQRMLELTDNILLQDKMPIDDKHNVGARILRHGLAVSAFALLEKYTRSIFDAMVNDMNNSTLLYHEFPDRLRKFISVDAIGGLNNTLYFIKDDLAKFAFVDTHLPRLSGYASSTPTYTAFGFSSSGSNVGHDDIKKGFAAFGLTDAWGKMSLIASDIGGGTLSLENEFRGLARARHMSAHEPASNIPTTTLQSHLKAAILLGITIDILASDLGGAIRNCGKKADLPIVVSAVAHSYRFLDEQIDGSWLERASAAGRGVKRLPDKDMAVQSALQRKSSSHIVVRDAASFPRELIR
ncbi:hypothetical protein ABGN05_23085 [Aquibium sp. LZ166]|uniref:RiboL-PSP-HEPN domain-containing protein n=1 Tax=Aquibium pacificus TaxID=3153579 RepID=A0ABV3SRH0_9HYPH